MIQSSILADLYRSSYSPFIYREDTDSEVVLNFEIPGVPKEAIEVSTAKGKLQLDISPPKGAGRLAVYELHNTWSASGVDLDATDVVYKDGLLSIKLKKVEPEKKLLKIN